MTVKEIDDQKTINFNPTFIFYELSNIFTNDSTLCFWINIILLGFSIMIIYFFFEIEAIFLYKYIFNKAGKTKKEEKLEKEYYNKIKDIFESKIECDNGEVMIIKTDGTRLYAKNLKNEKVGKVPFCQNIKV